MQDAVQTTILHVGGEEAGRYATTRRLRRSGYTVFEAATGAEGMLLASQGSVDLVILDVNLPDISGLEVARRLRSDPATAGIPILHLSATAVDESCLARGLESGSDAYLCQPVSDEVLLAQVRTLLRVGRMQQALRESRARYQVLLETTSDFIWEMDAHGRYTYCSPQMEHLWGLKPEEMIGKTPFDVMPADDAASAREQFMAMAESPRPFGGLATRAYDGQGRLIFIETGGAPFFDDRGRLLGFRGITRDVTEQKQMQEALRESEARRVQTLLDSADESIWMVAADGTVLAANTTAARRVGCLSVPEVVGKKWHELGSPEVVELRRKMANEVVRTSAPLHFEDAPAGRAFQHTLYPVCDGAGTVTAVAVFSRDVAEQKQAEAALRESEAKYRALFEMLPVTVVIHQDHKVALANPASMTTFRVPDTSRVIGQEVTPYLGGETRGQIEERLRAKERGRPEAPDHYFTTLRRADGEEFPAEVLAANVRFQERPATQVVILDITERMRMQEAARDSEARFRALFAAMSDVIMVLDAEGRYLEIAPTKPDLLYRPAEEVLGRTVHDIFPVERADYFVEHIRKALEAERTVQIEYSLPIRGQEYCFSATISPLSSHTVMVVARDVTAVVEQRNRLLASERARADLAEHLNEEINHRARNNLAMVSGLLQMQALREPNAEVAARLREAVARMRSFVDIHEKIYASGAEQANVLEVIRKMATTLRTVFAATAAEISVEGTPGLFPTRAVTNLAVITNELLTNALKHGGAGDGRAVQVKVRVDRAEGRLRISVWNSGPPLPDGFEPAAQKGMGLRLVTAFAEQYGGSFRAQPAEYGTLAELVVEEAALDS